MVIVLIFFNVQVMASHEQKDEDVNEPSLKKRLVESNCREIDFSFRDRLDMIPIKLSLSCNEHLENISFLLAFPNLTDLNLSFCNNLKDNYKPISQLTNLERLDLYGINLTTTEYLTPLVKLHYLKILCPDLGKCIIPLTHLKIKDLDIAGYNYKSLTVLSAMTSLESICFSNFYNEEEDEGGEKEFPSLDFLTPLVNLRSLDFSSNHLITHIEPLAKLPNLTSLDFSGCYRIEDLKSLTNLKSLKELNLSYISPIEMPTLNEDLSFLSRLTNLKELTISSYAKIPDNISDKVKLIVS